MANRVDRRLAVVALFVCLVMLGGIAAFAQEYRGTLTGRVTDEQDGAVPGVTVTARHSETGTTTNAVTDASGSYTFPLLAPGMYSVSAELSGFQRIVQDKIPLGSGQRLSIDLKLKV